MGYTMFVGFFLLMLYFESSCLLFRNLDLFFSFGRFKPFFPFQTLQGFEENEDEHIHIQQWALTEGPLKVTLLECSRYVLYFVIAILWKRKCTESILKQYIYFCFIFCYFMCTVVTHKLRKK